MLFQMDVGCSIGGERRGGRGGCRWELWGAGIAGIAGAWKCIERDEEGGMKRDGCTESRQMDSFKLLGLVSRCITII